MLKFDGVPAKVYPHEIRHGEFKRTGVSLLVVDPDQRERVDNGPIRHFQLACQFVNANHESRLNP
jgi:hypothetical protein